MKKLFLLVLAIPFLMGAGCTTTNKTDDAAKIKELENKITVLETNNDLEITESNQVATSTEQLATTSTDKSIFRPIENTKPTPDFIPHTTQESPKTTTATSSGIRILRPAEIQIVEKDFRNDLITIYKKKLSDLTLTIEYKKISRDIHIWNADDERAHITFVNSMSADSITPAAKFGRSIKQLELEEDLKVIEMYDKFIQQLEQNQQWLENELALINNNYTLISEAEYLLRENLLNANINIEIINKVSRDISDYQYFTGVKRAELDAQILSAAQRDVAFFNQEVASMQAEINSLPTITPQRISAPISTTPTNIQCTTTHSFNTLKTVCIEIPTMKSYTCNSKYDAFWKTTTNCYAQ